MDEDLLKFFKSLDFGPDGYVSLISTQYSHKENEYLARLENADLIIIQRPYTPLAKTIKITSKGQEVYRK
jgi:hypothetical protein|nr:MAG TPA: hypothetical protein [Caudoviricetes sp.]